MHKDTTLQTTLYTDFKLLIIRHLFYRYLKASHAGGCPRTVWAIRGLWEGKHLKFFFYILLYTKYA